MSNCVLLKYIIVNFDEFAIDIPENIVDPDGLLGRRPYE